MKSVHGELKRVAGCYVLILFIRRDYFLQEAAGV